jgi:peptidoglycan/xylan/chitin deacetylase (PgdA/CDA1 family)
LYHRISTAKPDRLPALYVSVDRFREQLAWLAGHQYTVISLDQWQDALEGNVRQPVLLTFDDAYSELCEYAFPLLREHGFHATVFVVSGLVGGYNQWDAAQGHAAHPLMTAEQIRYWAARGIDFGAHSRTHPDLRRLDDAGLASEIDGSGSDLAALLRRPVRAFAYPFGYSNARVRAYTASSFNLAFTCDRGLNSVETDPHLVHRSMVQPHDSLLDLAMRVRFGYAPIAALRSSVRLRTRLREALHLSTPDLV